MKNFQMPIAQLGRDESGNLAVMNSGEFDAEDLALLNRDLAKQREYQERSRLAIANATKAYERLLLLAETRDSGQVSRIASFLAGTFNGEAFPFDLGELRALDVEISDDMLTCLDAHRWSKDLFDLVPDGRARVLAVIDRWGLHWPEVK